MKTIIDYLKITLSVALVAAGLVYFMIPMDLAVGGISGFAIVVHHYFPVVPIGITVLLLNGVLFVIAMFLLGSSFGAKTFFASIMMSVWIEVFQRFVPIETPLVEDMLLNLFFGILITALGLGLLFHQNASSGGTDIIAKIINKYFNVDIGKSLFLADFLVVLAAAMTFGLDKGLYAMLGILMNATVVDNFIEGMETRFRVSLVSNELDEVKRFIIEELGRGATIQKAYGAYTGEDRDVLVAVCSRREYIKIKQALSVIDPNAFMTVSLVKEVMGEGFKLNI